MIKFSIANIFSFTSLSYFQLINALTTVRSVNKTDAMTLLTTFGTFEDIIQAPSGSLALCPGFGPQKAQRLHKTLHETFLQQKNTEN